jgi:hypothetical protein
VVGQVGLGPIPAFYTAGLTVKFKALNANTGASTAGCPVTQHDRSSRRPSQRTQFDHFCKAYTDAEDVVDSTNLLRSRRL